MRQYRGLTKDGEWVYGWYCKIEGIHYIIDNTVSHTWLEEDCYEVQGLVEVIPETVCQATGLKDKRKDLTELYEGDIIGVDGLLKGNQYENPNLLQEKTNLLIPPITSKDWQAAYGQAMERGCRHAE